MLYISFEQLSRKNTKTKHDNAISFEKCFLYKNQFWEMRSDGKFCLINFCREMANIFLKLEWFLPSTSSNSITAPPQPSYNTISFPSKAGTSLSSGWMHLPCLLCIQKPLVQFQVDLGPPQPGDRTIGELFIRSSDFTHFWDWNSKICLSGVYWNWTEQFFERETLTSSLFWVSAVQQKFVFLSLM